jgi:hypothetical protein
MRARKGATLRWTRRWICSMISLGYDYLSPKTEDSGVNRSLLLVFVSLLLSFASQASAQQGGAKLRLGAGMVVDFAGEWETPGRDPDLEATIGMRFHLDYDLAKYVSLGGFVRTTWWEAEGPWEDRSFLFDIGPRIAGHYDWRDFRFYVAAMPGLTISAVDDDYYFDIDNPGVGFNMSIAPGAEYWFTGSFGVYSELFGWIGHYFDHDSERGPGDYDFNLNQVAFNFGIVFAP